MPDVVQPAMHGRDHCPGGADPIPCLTGSVCHLYSWNYVDENTVPTATWRPVADFFGDRGYFESSFVVGNNWGFDYDTGQISLAADMEYVIYGWVQFWDDPVDGEHRVVAVNFGSSDRYIAEFSFDAAMGSIAALKLPVSTIRSTTLGTSSCWLEVWHDHGSDISIRDAEIEVRRHEWQQLGTFNDRP